MLLYDILELLKRQKRLDFALLPAKDLCEKRLICEIGRSMNYRPALDCYLSSKLLIEKSSRIEKYFKGRTKRNFFVQFLFLSTFSTSGPKPVMSWRCSGNSNDELVDNLKGKDTAITVYS